MQTMVSNRLFPHDLSLCNKVITCDKGEAQEFFPEILSKAGFEPREYGLVLVKPNLCGMYHPESQLIKRTFRFFEPYAQRIIISEIESMVHTPIEQ